MVDWLGRHWREWDEVPKRLERGIIEYTPEFSKQVLRRIQQRELRKRALPEEETLAQVRHLRRCPQSHIAAYLSITQPQVSRLERRTDALISTVTGYVEALGGSLDLVARFPALSVRIKLRDP